MALTKRQFRLLLVAYCVVIVVDMFWVAAPTKPLTAGDVAEAKRRFGLETWTDLDFAVFMVWMMATILVASIVGLVFAFLLWREGLYTLLIAVCARFTFFLVRYHHISMGVTGWTSVLLEVIILSFGLLGPAKHLFQRQREAGI